MTGFRLGLGGAQGYYGISPDLTCLRWGRNPDPSDWRRAPDPGLLTGRRIVDYRDTLTANWDSLAAVAQRVVANGIITTGQKMYLSLVHSEEDMAQIRQAWEKALDGLRPHN